MVNDGRGLYIPPEIWALEMLSISERIVLSEIAFLYANRGRCFASNDHFARLLNCSPSNARKIIYNLIQSGFVSRVSKSEHDQRLLCPNVNVEGVQIRTTPCPNPDTIENKVKPKTKPQKKPTRPNLDMVNEWFAENNAPMMAAAFFDYYETNGWVQGRGQKPIKDWTAAARGWIRRQNQFNGEKQQRGFDRQKFSPQKIGAWANQKQHVGDNAGENKMRGND